jgi:hypothetical protein
VCARHRNGKGGKEVTDVGCRHEEGDMKSKKQQEELGREERLRIDECLERAKSLP